MSASNAPELHDRGAAGARAPVGTSGAGVVLTLVIAAAVLYFARDIFVPLAIAGLLSFVLSPPMLWLRRHHLGRAPAAIIVVVCAFTAILGFGSVVVGEVASLTRQLPSEMPNIAAKLQSLRTALPINELVQRGTGVIQDLRDELAPSDGALPPGGASNAKTGQSQTPQPVPVTIEQQTGILQILENWVGPVLKPLGLAGLVLVFVIFFLLNRENLRDRFIRLAGAHDLHRTTQMLNDAVERLSRYLWSEFVVNAVYGFLMALGTFLIGVPNAALWGGMFLVLRFVPYIGTWLAAFFPLALSLTIAAGWSAFFETFGLFITVEMLTSQAIEPWVFGGSAGMSPVAVLVAATFWTWLWGPIGLVLSTPLTACLVVIGRYAPPLRFIAILFGDEAPLAAEESFYQRLLAGDAAEATEQTETFLKSGSLTAFCDQVAMPALLLAQEDSERGVLTRGSRAEIADTLRDIMDNVIEDDRKEDKPAPAATVECLGARNELDDAAALLLTCLLAEQGIAAQTVPARHWVTEPRLGATTPAAGNPPAVTCLSHLGSASPSRLRLLVRRLRRRAAARTHLVLGLWTAASLGEEERDLPADDIATSLAGAVEHIRRVVATTDDTLSTQSPQRTTTDAENLPQESEALPH